MIESTRTSVWTREVSSTGDRRVVALNRGGHGVTLSEPDRAWVEPVKRRLDVLASLPSGWNGYQGRPTRFSVAHFAFHLLQHVAGSNTAVPHIIPGPDGDLQLEWHDNGMDVELHILAPYRVRAWRRTAETGEDGEECDLTTNYAIVQRWLRQMSEAIVAAPAAAA